VGIFPPGARWYLAIIATIALLCVAIHLSIQIHVQKQAEELLQQWGDDAGIEIGSVRYHLLRNGLILKNVSLQRETDSLKIKHMLIRANPKLLTGDTPKIGRVEIAGFEAVVWNPDQQPAWQNDQKLMRIWKASQSLKISSGSLTFQVRNKPNPPVKLDIISLEQQVQKSLRSISAHTLLAGAPISWQWSSHDGPQGQNSAKGSINWQRVDSRLLTSAMGLATSEGQLTGSMSWAIPDNTKVSIQGHTELNSKADSNQQISWSGKQTNGDWKLDMKTEAWPVHAWTESLPIIAERTLKHGLLDAELHWLRQGGAWRLTSKHGSLHEVSYTNRNQSEQSQQAWEWGHIEYNDLRLNFSSRKLHADSIRTEQSSMVIQLKEKTGKASQQRYQNSSHWDISANKIDIEDMTLGLATTEGKLLLPALKGRCSWSLDNNISFNLRSMHQQAEQHTALQQEGRPQAGWRVTGEAKYTHGNINKSAFKLSGKNLELAQLRALIPLRSSQDSALGLTGMGALSMNVTITNGLWQAYGKASANNILFAYAGNEWKADRIETRFGPVGMGLKSQRIDSITADGWHYVTALRPLLPHISTANTDPKQNSWWVSGLRKQNWEIGKLAWKNGKVSIGNSDLLWAEDLNINITQLKPEQWASVDAQGLLGQGQFSLDGQWYALADKQRFTGRASLDNGLPFFLYNWMTTSGMPGLVRGRLSAELSIKDGKEENSYSSFVKLKLARAVAETTVSPHDPMIARTGFSTPGLLDHLNDSNKLIALDFDNHGNWLTQPLSLNLIGTTLLQTMQQAALASSKNSSTGKPVKKQTAIVDTRIRLRDTGSLSLNERTRLRKSIKMLAQKTGWTLELIPKWTGESITNEAIQRIRYTQKIIERFVIHQRLPQSKLYPIWPTANDHANEISAIWVTLTPPD